MTFSEQLIHLIDEFAKRIGVVIDWTNDNVMPYLSDLITRYGQFHLTTNSIKALYSANPHPRASTIILQSQIS